MRHYAARQLSPLDLLGDSGVIGKFHSLSYQMMASQLQLKYLHRPPVLALGLLPKFREEGSL